VKKEDEAPREILKGLEGLEMLGQWNLSLVRDLMTKTKALLDPPQGGGTSGQSGGPGPASD
jgi:hypothetical protein